MATEPDPYRTLGLPRTASLTEVKAAYRRLAKANHPDTAGEAAVPRFLAIQAAYERLAGPTPGRRAAAAPTPPAPKRQPWEADPDRSDATHRAYGGRARRPAGSTSRKTGSRPKSGSTSGSTSGTTGGGTDGARAAGGTGTTGDPASTKDPKKATLGSTSYDEADREAFEPDWAGSSWYGTTSGTYWTINPKEYADPRKHGPEYQARARRASQAGKDADAGIGAGPGATAEPAATPEKETMGEPGGAGGAASAGGPAADPTPRHTTSSWWDATSGAAAHGRDAGDHAPPSPTPRPSPTSPPRPAPRPAAETADGDDGLAAAWRALTEGAPPSFGWRLARAVIGAIPIALAIGWTVGEMSGCARYAASCDDGIGLVGLVAQVLVFLVLLALPVVASWAVIAAIVSLVVAVPATLFITANAGAQASTVGGGFLGLVLALAWVLGIVGAIVMGRRRSLDPTGPVS